MLLGAYVVILDRASEGSRAERLPAGYVSNRGNAYSHWFNSLCFFGTSLFQAQLKGVSSWIMHLEPRTRVGWQLSVWTVEKVSDPG
jgi:hypothetical protein